MQNRVVRSLALVSALAFSFAGVEAQQAMRGGENAIAKPTPPAASAPTSVPALVPYTGFGAGADGKAITGEVPVTFLIYKEETGGEPLFTETQTAAFDAEGRYAVQLGATLSRGIPIELFGTGEARWLEVQIAGAKVQPRALLVSVPYALKAGDASTLGGLPASAYALAGNGKVQAATSIGTGIGMGGVTPDTATPVTTTGGTSGYLPVFNGGATVVDSILFQSSTGIGIGDTPNSSYRLDVNGQSILRGLTNLPSTGAGTASAGKNSYPLMFAASAYNSSTKADDNPVYYWQAEPSGNNTASPNSTMNLLYNANYGAGNETGLYFNPNGTIHFSSAQTFTATNATVALNGNSTSGLGVEGTSSSGPGVQGNSTSSNGVYGKSSTGDGLQGVTAGTTLNTAGVLGVAGTGNTSGFTGIAGVWGDANAHVGVFGSSTQYSGVQGTSANSYGVQGSSVNSYGVIGTTSAANGSAAAGVYGYSSNGNPGVKGASATADGGDFYGGGSGSGVQGVGGDANSNIAGYGGNFTGGDGGGSYADGGTGVNATGGGSGPSTGGYSGIGMIGGGGYTDSGDASVGGLFYGGSSNTGYAGVGLIADPGYSSSNGFGIYSAELNGDVDINGTVHTDVAKLTIDDPLDPANKYLSHASIESSEMVNIYSGNVTTDEQGLATVQLPSWFETLNGDLRYQLTAIGHKAQAWVSAEVKDGKFQIASDMANVKVSWQITGVRQDAYAKAHPLVVEEGKDARERGFYRHPELYGQPAQKQTEWGRHPNLTRTMAQQTAQSPIKSPVKNQVKNEAKNEAKIPVVKAGR